MNYQQAIDFLNSSPNYEILPRPAHTQANYDLRRVHELLALLGNPHLKAKSVHITGSNGKGSTSAMIASALTASGYVTGLYISPHLHTWRERVQIDGKLISEEEWAATVDRMKPHADDVNRRATYGKLTTFEMLTALGFAYFASKGVEFQVLEVGMGGKYDATSVITPEVAILTPISLEHTDVLGPTLTAIASEKAAIIKPGSTVVTPPQPPEVEKVIEETSRKLGARRVKVGVDVTWQSLGF
ncbi:MAG: Mur ligase family protein, partial [Dehalococcoidales bacterium]|nr:Mur ligase family protein [Dehalococcoidales bacterium]